MAKRTQSPRPPSGAPSTPVTQVVAPRQLIVMMKPEAGLRAEGAALASVTGINVTSLGTLLAASGATISPLFGGEERVRAAMATAPLDVRSTGPGLEVFYNVDAAEGKLDKLAADLLKNNLVDAAFVRPAPEPPVMLDAVAPPIAGVAPPATPDFTARQLYLDPAPGGIDARFAWTRPGGRGQGVRIIDVEGEWRFSHEDLTQNQGGVIGGVPPNDLGWRNHGTAVTSEFGGDLNAFGVTGICSDANVRAISIFGGGQSPAKAITDAANALSPGDIILIELHAPGPHFNFQAVNGQQGFVAMEFWPDIFAAIVFATLVRGVIVVEAGGNGSENFDDPLYNNRPAGFPATWTNPFNLANPQSGAIIVGAGAPPPGTHGRNWGADRSRLDFSNYGSRVDVQGWGREVTSCGYGDLQGGGNEDLWYSDTFSGTSSASPIIVGAVGCMQGGLRGGNKPLLTPATARNILRTTGSPQQDEPGRPATQRIGNRPNLRQAFQQLGIGGKQIIKDIIKEKDRIKDFKEIKEKDRKDLIKDGIKDIKEKELKELAKERIKDFKDLKEKDGKEIREVQDIRDLQQLQQIQQLPAEGDLNTRVAQLEQSVASLVHFIEGAQRPDLASSALRSEPDLEAISRELEKQSNEAKSMKDDKDIEKLREA